MTEEAPQQHLEECSDPDFVLPDRDAKVLWGINGSKTFAEAVEDVPETWALEIVGPIHAAWEAQRFAASVHPMDLPENHRILRIRNRGLMKGAGSTRLEALKKAALFTLSATRQGIDQMVFGMTAETLDMVLDGVVTPAERIAAWLDEAEASMETSPARSRQALNRAKYAISHRFTDRDAEGRTGEAPMTIMSILSDVQHVMEHGSADHARAMIDDARSRLAMIPNDKERPPQDR